MKLEKEITVLVNCDYETLHNDLLSKNFKIINKYQLDDLYLKPENIDINKMDALDILSKSVLIRKIGDFKKTLTYKYKKYSSNGDIIEQGKTECTIDNILDATNFMKAIGYEELLTINDTIIVYSNNEMELAVQLVNNKYIFIELEDENKSTGKYYNTIDEMIEDLKNINLDCNYNNFYCKKAEMIFNDTYR